ncbi:MAG: hypothetical protein ACOCXJ_05570 [Planctomycetota bacterium]
MNECLRVPRYEQRPPCAGRRPLAGLRCAVGLILLLCLFPRLMAAEGMRLIDAHDHLRPGLPWRLQLAGQALPAAAFPLRLRVRLEAGPQVLAAADERIHDPRAWQLERSIYLLPETPLAADDLRWVAELAGSDGRSLGRLRGPLQSSGQLMQAAAGVRPDPDADPLLGLWWQQSEALLASQRLASLQHATRLLDRLATGAAALRRHRQQRIRQEAWRSPDDGSLQATLLALPETAAHGSVLWLHATGDDDGGLDWHPELPPSLQELRQHGQAILAPSPAGDGHWRDLARSRARAALAQAQVWLPESPPLLVADGAAADAGLWLLARSPWAWRGLLLIDPRPLPASDSRLAHPLPQQLHDPLAYAPQVTRCAVAVLHHSGAYAETLRQLRAADPSGLWQARSLRSNAELTTWLTRLTAPSRDGVWELRSPLPLDLGGIALVQPSDWGSAMILRGELSAGHLLASGIADLRSDFPIHSLNGRDWRPPAAAPGVHKRLGSCLGLPQLPLTEGFALVVGTGGHPGVTERNRRNAEAFLAAWEAHAHGSPPLIMADEPIPEDRHLICFGTPRTHPVLRRAWADAPPPLHWDERQVRFQDRSWLRDTSGLVLCWPDGTRPSRCVLAIAGERAPQLYGEGLPCAQLPDLSIIDGDGRLMQHVFSVDWQ